MEESGYPATPRQILRRPLSYASRLRAHARSAMLDTCRVPQLRRATRSDAAYALLFDFADPSFDDAPARCFSARCR